VTSGREEVLEASERWSQLLHAYHDGELGWLARRRVERRLGRDPAARQELASLGALGAALRDLDAGSETPDLWAGVRTALPASAPAARPWYERLLGPLPRAPLALAAGVAVAALVFGVWATQLAVPTGSAGAVRWLDGRGRPLMVLRDDAEATIIWLPGTPETSGGRARDGGIGGLG